MTPPMVERHREGTQVPVFSLLRGLIQETRLEKGPDFLDGQFWRVPP